MWRDPLDELIEDLEGIFPPARAPKCDIPGKFFEMAERLDREIALERAQQHPRAEEPPSTISIAPPVWPTPPARRWDPSAPTWDSSSDIDSDDSGG